MHAQPAPRTPRSPGRVADLGTIQARMEAWDEPGYELALADSHGALVVILAGCRLALAHDVELDD